METIAKPSKRITEIDALRAFVLLGILLVHTANHFGYGAIDSLPATKLSKGILLLLSNRCALLFAVLFGCSFYLILKNPLYPAGKFVWRCIILFGIGVIAKIFYTWDVLLWYGINGCLLVLVKDLKLKQLLWVFFGSWIAYLILSKIPIGSFIFSSCHFAPRYTEASTLRSIVTYPVHDSIVEFLSMVLNGGVFDCFSKMVLGYYLAKKGYIYRLREFANKRNILILMVVYSALWVLRMTLNHFGIKIPVFSVAVYSLMNYSGAFFYALIFIWIYVKCESKLRWMESYGRLGLTNYFFEGIIGVILFTCIFKPMAMPFAYILLIMLTFYALQSIFSVVWLKHHKYGPMETLWRKATDLYGLVVKN